MEVISSVQNPVVKEAKKLKQKKHRDIRGMYLIEGIRLTEEALHASCLQDVFFDDTLLKRKRGQGLLQKIIEQGKIEQGKEKEAITCYQTTGQVLKTLAETETPQGIVAVVRKAVYPLRLLTDKGRERVLLIIDGVGDPGNLGTLIRTAWAAGAAGVVCLPGTTDPFNGKAVRASMGGVFHVPLVTEESWPDVRDWCREFGYRLVAGDIGAKRYYYEPAYGEKTAVIIGNEGEGLQLVKPEEIDCSVKIPLRGKAESLNAAVSGGILLYEILRQRSAGK